MVLQFILGEIFSRDHVMSISLHNANLSLSSDDNFLSMHQSLILSFFV